LRESLRRISTGFGDYENHAMRLRLKGLTEDDAPPGASVAEKEA
jgi:hypothetical protein